MGKGHRDNHKARKKRGSVAFAKKAARRTPEARCTICGTVTRPQRLTGGVCKRCMG